MPITIGKYGEIWDKVLKEYPEGGNLLLCKIQRSVDFKGKGRFMLLSVLRQEEVDSCSNYLDFFFKCANRIKNVGDDELLHGDMLYEVLQDLSSSGKYIYSVDPLLYGEDAKEFNENKYHITVEDSIGTPIWQMDYMETSLEKISYFCGVGSTAMGMFLMITNSRASSWPIEITHIVAEIADGDAYLLWIANSTVLIH
jgi:hypothetical protein